MAGRAKRKNRTGESKYSPRRLDAIFQKQLKAVEMRRDGETYNAIAQKLGYKGHDGVYQAIRAAIAKTLQEPVDAVIQIELARYDKDHRRVERAIASGEVDLLEGIGMKLRISKARRELLGTDAPAQMKLSGVVGLGGEVKVDHRYDQLKELLASGKFRALAGELVSKLGA